MLTRMEEEDKRIIMKRILSIHLWFVMICPFSWYGWCRRPLRLGSQSSTSRTRNEFMLWWFLFLVSWREGKNNSVIWHIWHCWWKLS